MAIYTFSTKATRPNDTELVDRVKKICDKQNVIFSSVVIDLLREWESKHASKQRGN